MIIDRDHSLFYLSMPLGVGALFNFSYRADFVHALVCI